MTPPLLLNLGCGERTHPAWQNIDYSKKIAFLQLWFVKPFIRTALPANYTNYDLRRGIPYKTGIVDAVYASHVLEHILFIDAPNFLKEILRVLKPGGVIRLVVPDLELAVRNYLQSLEAVRNNKNCNNESKLRHEWDTIYLLDQLVRTECGGEMTAWLRRNSNSTVVAEMSGILKSISTPCNPNKLKELLISVLSTLKIRNPASSGELHRWMYDDVSLAVLLQNAGFREILRVDHMKSRIDEWASFGLDNNYDNTPHQPGSIWMEAIK